MVKMAAASSSSGGYAAADAPAAASNAVAAAAAAPATLATAPKPAAKPVNVLTTPSGEVIGISVSPAMQLYTTVDRFVGMSRLMALPIADRYALAGKVAALPDEHPRLVERLASNIATSLTEVNALNALYFLELCQELVPGFSKAIPEKRIETAAELSPHPKVQAAVLKGEKPPQWEAAKNRPVQSTVVMMPQQAYDEYDSEDDGDIVTDAAGVVGDGAKFVGSAALGGVGLVGDTLGLTDNAEVQLADAAEDAVDLVGDGANYVVDTLDEGIDGTAVDFKQKGVVGAVGDGAADAADLMQDFVEDAVTGIADGVRGLLDFVTDNDSNKGPAVPQTHKLAIIVGELFGDERTLGLRIESRIITKFTKPEAEKTGWKLGDCIVGVGTTLVNTQDDMLAQIAVGKEALKNSGTPIRFLVERMGARPGQTAHKRGDMVTVGGRVARIQEIQPSTGTVIVQYQDDGSMAKVTP